MSGNTVITAEFEGTIERLGSTMEMQPQPDLEMKMQTLSRTRITASQRIQNETSHNNHGEQTSPWRPTGVTF